MWLTQGDKLIVIDDECPALRCHAGNTGSDVGALHH